MNWLEEIIKSIDVICKVDDDTLVEVISGQVINAEDALDQINNFEDTITDLLSQQRDRFISSFDEFDTLEAIIQREQPLFDADVFASEMGLASTSFFDSTISDLVGAYIATIDTEITFEIFTDRTTAFIEGWSEELGDLMQLTSHNDISRLLSNNITAGNSIDDLTSELEGAYAFSRTRARTTAITEVLRAHSYAKQEAFIQSPAVTGKIWKHSGPRGIDAREAHVALDGATVGLLETFNVNGTQAQFPRDTSLPPAEVVS